MGAKKPLNARSSLELIKREDCQAEIDADIITKPGIHAKYIHTKWTANDNKTLPTRELEKGSVADGVIYLTK